MDATRAVLMALGEGIKRLKIPHTTTRKTDPRKGSNSLMNRSEGGQYSVRRCCRVFCDILQDLIKIKQMIYFAMNAFLFFAKGANHVCKAIESHSPPVSQSVDRRISRDRRSLDSTAWLLMARSVRALSSGLWPCLSRIARLTSSHP